MNQINENKKRVGALFLLVLVLIFVFGGSWSRIESGEKNERDVVLKAAPVEQIAFRDSSSDLKFLLDFASKTQFTSAHFIPFVVDFPSLEVANTTCLSVTDYLFNSFYTHLTAKAP